MDPSDRTMRTRLKACLACAYEATGGLRRLHAGRVVILTFHRVRPGDGEDTVRPMRNLEVPVGDFRRILTSLRERYEPLALSDWIGRTTPPDRASFIVTFDDGWADNLEYAFPVLRELGIPATIFLATGAVHDRVPFWWQLPDLADDEIERLKHEPPHLLEARLAADPAATWQERNGDFLTWAQIAELGRSGLVTFGPHGHRHALLTALSRAEALEDIRHCWALLKEHVPAALVPVLAWPNGNARQDLDVALEELGLRAALGTRRGAATTVAKDRWDLPRNNVDYLVARAPELLPWLLLRAR